MTDYVINVSASTTLTLVDRVVLVDSSAGPVDLTLPANPVLGERHGIKDYGSNGRGACSVHPIRVNPNGRLIDGSPNIVTLGPDDGDELNLISNGTDWGIFV